MTKPYVYRLFHEPTGYYYYGGKWTEGADPNLLWNTYYSLSSKVHKLIDLYGGDTFNVKVVKVFDNRNSCISFLNKITDRTNKSEKSLNYKNHRSELKKNFCVLLAEDSGTVSMIIKSILKKLGVECLHAQNGLEAFILYKEMYDKIDLVFMDCEMPVMDGYKATEKIRSYSLIKSKKQIPIVGLTGHASAEHGGRALIAGMDYHITKPVSADVLKDVIIKYQFKS
jgi:CheY-like chemotaxis protein